MNRRREKMNREDRAKQFMPFDALKGFREALAEKERILLPRKELTEEQNDNLNRKISAIQKNDSIIVDFYNEGEYLRMSGKVRKIDAINRQLLLGNKWIAFDDIFILTEL